MKKKKSAALISCLLILAMAAGCGSGSSAVSSSSASNTSTKSAAASQAVTDAGSTQSESSGTDSSESAAPTPTEAPVSLTLKVDGTDKVMEVLVPGTWADLRGQLDKTGEMDQNYPIQTGSYDEESFLIANRESKLNSSLASLKEYSDTIVQGVAANKSFSDIQTGETSDITLKNSGFKAKKTEIIASYAGQQIAYWVYAAEGKDDYYQFCCWTADDNASKAEPNFDAVVNSFTVLA